MAAQVQIFEDVPSLARSAAQTIMQHLVAAIQERGSASIALAGGTTPMPVYSAMSEAPLAALIDWGKLSLFWGDERCVSKTDPASNFGAAMKAFRSHDRNAPVHRTRIFRMHAEHENREIACREYESLLPAKIDVLLLGVGEDGHTASLFPGSPAMRESTRKVVAVIGPKPPPHRLTITPKVIEDARLRIVLASGQGKAERIRAALEGPANAVAIPCQLAKEGQWFLDRSAASMLAKR